MKSTIQWTLAAVSMLFSLGLGACSSAGDTVTTGSSGTGGAGGTGSGTACDGSPITPEQLIAEAPAMICNKYKECCPGGFMDGPITGTGANCEAEVKATLEALYGPVGTDPRTDWDAAKAGQCCNEIFMRLDSGPCTDPALFGPKPPVAVCGELITGLQDMGAPCDRDDECRDGLRCDFASQTCIMPAAEGSACNGLPCDDRAYCDMIDQTCKPQLANGEACTDANQCQSGVCRGGTCSTYSSFQDVCI